MRRVVSCIMNFPKKKTILGSVTLLLTIIILGFEERDVAVNALHMIVIISWVITVVTEAIVLLFLRKWRLGLSVLILFPLSLFLPDLINYNPEIVYKAQLLLWFILPSFASLFLINYQDDN